MTHNGEDRFWKVAQRSLISLLGILGLRQQPNALVDLDLDRVSKIGPNKCLPLF
jgi:hypothetical protein